MLFIATANQLGTIHPALLDRMEIISLSGYTEEEKVHIAKMYLVPRQREEHGLKPEQLVDRRRRAAPGDLGVHARSRRPHARAADRRASRARWRRRWRPTRRYVGSRDAPKDVPDYLGPARFRSDGAFRLSRPGVATGLAWTEAGGDVLFIEAVLLPGGSGHLTLTGQLGNVMQESARAALSHVRQMAPSLGIPPELLSQARPAHPRPRRRDSQGRPVGRRHHGDGDRVGGARRAGARRRRDDRRDHAVRPGAAGRRHPREGAGGARHGIKTVILPQANDAGPGRAARKRSAAT